MRVFQAVICFFLIAAAARADDRNFWLESPNRKIRHERSVIAKVAAQALPAVVYIETHADASKAASGLGSGFVIHPDGYILTNHHVTKASPKITVSFLSQSGALERLEAKLVGSDAELDLALLKVEAVRSLPVLRLSSSEAVEVGDWLVVVGCPKGYHHSVSAGVLSYKGRRISVTGIEFESGLRHLQTDAAINSGNSGGPVLDVYGDVIGIANAVTADAQGVNFVLPIEVAKRALPDLKNHGRVRRGWLGVSLEKQKDAIMSVQIAEVKKDGPADRAGLLSADVITKIADQTIFSPEQARELIRRFKPGRKVKVEFLRNDKASRAVIVLGDETEAS